MYFVSRETDLSGRIFSEGSRDLQGLLRVKQIVRPDSEATSAIYDTYPSGWTGECGLHRTLTQMWASLSQDEAHLAFPGAHHVRKRAAAALHLRGRRMTAPLAVSFTLSPGPLLLPPNFSSAALGDLPLLTSDLIHRNIELLCAPLTHLLSCPCNPVWKAPPWLPGALQIPAQRWPALESLPRAAAHSLLLSCASRQSQLTTSTPRPPGQWVSFNSAYLPASINRTVNPINTDPGSHSSRHILVPFRVALKCY